MAEAMPKGQEDGTPQANLIAGLKLTFDRKYEQAVAYYDLIADLTALEDPGRQRVAESYYRVAKRRLSQGDPTTALSCLTRALDALPGFDLAAERMRLMKTCRPFRTAYNLRQYRRLFSVTSFTVDAVLEGRFPFLEAALECCILSGLVQRMPQCRRVERWYAVAPFLMPDQGKDHVSWLMREYKKKGRRELAEAFSWLMADYVECETPLVADVDFIIPCPSNPTKAKTLGFEPSLEIAERLAANLMIPSRRLLRSRPHPERFRKMVSRQVAYELLYVDESSDLEEVRGRHILLVDDIITSGTTISLAAQRLREHKVGPIYGLAFCRTGSVRGYSIPIQSDQFAQLHNSALCAATDHQPPIGDGGVCALRRGDRVQHARHGHGVVVWMSMRDHHTSACVLFSGENQPIRVPSMELSGVTYRRPR